jgi:DNA-directed RNA polymerase subunit RPC12/RpoP
MGDVTAWYVPERQHELAGKAEEIADRFWKLGVFLSTPNDHIKARLRELTDKGIELPPWDHDFSFVDMGIGDEAVSIPIPYNVYDASCPHCGAEVYEQFTDAVSEALTNDDDPRDEHIRCPRCEFVFRASETAAPQTGFAFARFYVWVSDIQDDDWDSSFKATVESVLGPCREIIAWDT